ncbi:MAG: hypothetical protein ACREVP_04835 [Burkholderiales bacterium]
MTRAKRQSSFTAFPPLPYVPVDMLFTGAAPAADYSAQIKVWTTYTQYLASAAGMVRVSDSIVHNSIKDPELYQKLHGAFKSVYDALSGVDKEFIAGIQAMQQGKPPSYTFDPAPVPDWPDDPTKSGLFLAAWASIKPGLEVLLNKMPSGGAFATAIAGLLDAGDKCAADLEKAFSK